MMSLQSCNACAVQDVTSGICRQTNQDAGRDMNAKEHADFTQCGFNSMEGFALGEQLECNVRTVHGKPTLLLRKDHE